MISTIIDKYWHNFIIYTYEYQSWCLDKYNHFIHHLPTPEYEKESSDNLDNLKSIAYYFKSYFIIFHTDCSIKKNLLRQ
ncbi:hypothetical protein Neuguinea66_12150 [Helicobacter pylori]